MKIIFNYVFSFQFRKKKKKLKYWELFFLVTLGELLLSIFAQEVETTLPLTLRRVTFSYFDNKDIKTCQLTKRHLIKTCLYF